MSADLKKRLYTYLRMTESSHGGESEEAGRQFFKLLRKHGLLRPLVEHPEWLFGHTDEKELREVLEANAQFRMQNDAIREENKRLRADIAGVRKVESEKAKLAAQNNDMRVEIEELRAELRAAGQGSSGYASLTVEYEALRQENERLRAEVQTVRRAAGGVEQRSVERVRQRERLQEHFRRNRKPNG